MKTNSEANSEAAAHEKSDTEIAADMAADVVVPSQPNASLETPVAIAMGVNAVGVHSEDSAALAAAMAGDLDASTANAGAFAASMPGANAAGDLATYERNMQHARDVGAAADVAAASSDSRLTNMHAGSNAVGRGTPNSGAAGADAASTTSAANARATTGANETSSKADALAQVMGQMMNQAMGEVTTQASRANSAQGSVIAGRLAEVEASIARSRASQAINATGTQIDGIADISAEHRGVVSDAAVVGIGTSGDSQDASMGDNATSQQQLSFAQTMAASSGPFGQGASGSIATDLAVPASQVPAADLAAVANDDASPAAQLAAKGAELLAKHRGGAITMRLEPPALGQLKIELRIAHGAVVADFTAATPEARMLLESNLGMLRERLESQGLSIDRLTVHGARGSGDASVATTSNAQQGDTRQQSDARGDASDRQSDRSGTRQDAAGGESRGRRDGERPQQDQDGRRRDDGSQGEAASNRAMKRGFAGALADAGSTDTAENGKRTTRTAESVRRAG